MNKKEILQSLLSNFSIVDLENALRVLEVLSQHNFLQPKYVAALLHMSHEMNISSPDFVESITITTSSDEADTDELSNFVSHDNKSDVVIQKKDSDDIFLNIGGESVLYKRSLSNDIDKLLV